MSENRNHSFFEDCAGYLPAGFDAEKLSKCKTLALTKFGSDTKIDAGREWKI